MKIDAYRVIRRAVEEGAFHALHRATKHVEWSHWEPEGKRNELAQVVADAVVSELCEWFRFEGEEGEPET